MKYLLILCCSMLILSCSESDKKEAKNQPEQETQKPVTDDPDARVEITGNIYREYYNSNKTKIKFEGTQDEELKRHGKWTHYHENGTEASMTFYTHGIRNGYSQVKRPNGTMYYHGEYIDDKPAGVWKYYDEKGVLVNEHNYEEK